MRSSRPPPYTALPGSYNADSYDNSNEDERTSLVVIRRHGNNPEGSDDKPTEPSWKVIFLVALVVLCITQIILKIDGIWRPETEEQRRERFERWEREERHQIEHQGSYWGQPRPERCVAYGVREYKAYLMNLPHSVDNMKSCHYSRINIHGREILSPDSCGQDRGGVFGYWKVGFEEYECQPFWGKFYKLGCTYPNSGKRKVESRIWGLMLGHDWHAICRTTPAVIDGVIFPKPLTCRDESQWLHGFIGVWEIDDESCFSSLALSHEPQLEGDLESPSHIVVPTIDST